VLATPIRAGGDGGGGVAGDGLGAAALWVVGDGAAGQPGRAGEPVGDAFDEPEGGGRGAEGGGEQVGEQGGGDLVADVGLYVCSYPLAEHAELSVFVVGGASVGHGVRGVEFGD